MLKKTLQLLKNGKVNDLVINTIVDFPLKM